MAKLLYIFLIPWSLFAYAVKAQAYSNFAHDSTLEVFSKGGKKGLRRENGNVLIGATYQDLGWSDGFQRIDNKFIGFKQNNLWGLLSSNYEEISRPKYSSLIPFEEDLFIASRKSKYSKVLFYSLIKANGKNKIKPKYRNLYPAGSFLIAATKKESTVYFGVINSSGKTQIPFEFFHISYLEQNNFSLTKEDGSKQLIKLSPKPKVLYENMDSVSTFKDGVAVIFKKGKQGLIRQDGKILLPINYKKIEWNKDKQIYVTHLEKWTILNQDGRTISTQRADSIFYLEDSLMVKNISSFAQIFNPFTEENEQIYQADIIASFGEYVILQNSEKIYLADKNGTPISDKFEGKVESNQNFFVAKKKTYEGYEYVVFNNKGQSIIADSFYFTEKNIALKFKSNWGIFNKDLQEVIPPFYQEIRENGFRYVVNFKGNFGVIDQENNWVIPPQYKKIELISDQYYKLVDKYLGEFISNGEEKRQAILYYDFYEQYGVEQDLNNKFRLINHKGLPLSDFRIGTYSGHGESGILFRNGKELMLLDSLGNELFTINNYDTVAFSKDEYLAIQKNGQWGFINTEGLLRVANRYEAVRPFYNDRAAIKIRNSWGFINRDEDIIIQPYFSEVSNFEQNTAFVQYHNKFGLIDETGAFIIEAEYDEIKKDKDFYLLRKGSKWGIANPSGKVIIYPSYDYISVGNGFLQAEKYGSIRILTYDGSSIINQQFDNIYYDSTRRVFIAKKKAEKEQVFLTDILSGKYP